jgi:hypothetical protein
MRRGAVEGLSEQGPCSTPFPENFHYRDWREAAISTELRPYELNCVDRASLLTQTATYTGFGIVEARYGFIVHFAHAKSLEGANGRADFASHAIFLENIRLGPVNSLDSFRFLTLSVSDRAVGAAPGAYAALDAPGNIDAVGLFLFSAGGPCWTVSCAGLATFTLFRDDTVGH